ncbi:MAG: hypothetical protein LBC87_04080 [Fibromonadaceae bacterium]|jgi:hypothetical protein|nr:hypothetical protein [Fibromonadaceae bacterium]
MNDKRKAGLGIKGAQTLPATRINRSNIEEAVQKLCDLLGAAKLGKVSDTAVYMCGVLLRNVDKELSDLDSRIKKLETKNEGQENG